MKIREMLDRLDEISRRDFLKGAGVGAVAGAMGAAGINALKKNPNDYERKYLNPEVWRLIGYIRPIKNNSQGILDRTDSNDLETIFSEAERVVKDFGQSKEYFKSVESGSEDFFRNVNALRSQLGLDTRYSAWIGEPQLEQWIKSQAQLTVAKLRKLL